MKAYIERFILYVNQNINKNLTKGEDVDGRAEDLLRPLVKLVFLKILLVDIGISLGMSSLTFSKDLAWCLTVNGTSSGTLTTMVLLF